MKKGKRILHIIKTNTGAVWAYRQIEKLQQMGLQITVMLPRDDSGFALLYKQLGIPVVAFDASLPVTRPWRIFQRIRSFRILIKKLKPDLVHCHFVTNIIFCRLALRNRPIPRLFQVPGPLHLENVLFRYAELLSSDQNDYWAGSCHKTCDIYEELNVPKDRIFFGYYASDFDTYAEHSQRSGKLRREYNIPEDSFLIGTVSYFYKPKYYLLQFAGIKGHEDFIRAFYLLHKKYPKVRAVIIGGPAPGSEKYAQRLMRKAKRLCGDAIIFTGHREDISEIYPDLDLAVHPSRSENYGGCGESLAYGIPTLTTDVGGFPEFIREKETGYLVPAANPYKLAKKMEYIMKHYRQAKETAKRGQEQMQRISSSLSAKQAYEMYSRIFPDSIKATFFYDIRFLQQDGAIYSHYGVNDRMFDRYLAIFDQFTYVGRLDPVTDQNRHFLKEQYRVHNISLITFKNNYSDVRQVVRKAVEEAQFCILRLPSIAGALAWYECERQHKPYAAEVVGNIFEALWYHSLKGRLVAFPLHLLMRYVIRRSRYVAYLTESYLQKHYPTRGRAYGGITNVSLPKLEEDILTKRIDKIKGLDKQQFIHIGLIGSLDVNYKGQDTAIKALALLKDRYPMLRLNFLGPGSKERWEAMAREAGVEDCVNFCGTLPGGQPVYDWLDQMDIYIQPSLTEGHGRAVVEAMSRSCVAFASNTGGLVDSLPAEYLFPKRDEKKLAALIERAITDHEFALKAARDNFQRAKRFQEEVIEQKRRKFYSSALRYWKLQ